MKKTVLFAAFLMLLQTSFAGGLVTNYNQSAQYIRMLARNASLEIDGVFYNPAGIVKMEDGWHVYFSGQTILQTREMNSEFPFLNDGFYEGKTTIPIFPNFYAAYVKNKWAFSLGVGPVGGGGTATFDNGMPSFEIPISKAVPALADLAQINPALAVTGYDLDMQLEASSVFWGIQLGASYEVNDVFSLFGGVRIVPATNSYKGSITNVAMKTAGGNIAAPTFLQGAAAAVSGVADIAYGSAAGIQPIIDLGGGSYTLAQLEGAGFISATQRAQIEGGLAMLGVDQSLISAMNAGQVQGAFNSAGDGFAAKAATLEQTAGSMADRHVDVKQTGLGFTPIIGINISPNDDWNLGVKYEHKTKLNLENNTTVDEMGLFPDGVKVSNDIPGILSAGVAYRGLDWLEAQLSYTTYFDKGVSYGYNVRYLTAQQQVEREIDKNYYELSLGLQFNLTDNFAISVGGLRSQNGVGANYQSDFSFTNASDVLGAGIMWKLSDRLTLDAGISNIFYEEDTVEFEDVSAGTYKESYNKTTISMAAGITYSIF